MHIIKKNKKSRFDYFLIKQFIAGIILNGYETKNIKAGNIDISEGYVKEENGELYLWNCPITIKSSNSTNFPDRKRKLLLHKSEILEIKRNILQKGITIIPVAIGVERGLIKAEIAIAKGKKNYDKRQSIKDKESERLLRKYVLKDA